MNGGGNKHEWGGEGKTPKTPNHAHSCAPPKPKGTQMGRDKNTTNHAHSCACIAVKRDGRQNHHQNQNLVGVFFFFQRPERGRKSMNSSTNTDENDAQHTYRKETKKKNPECASFFAFLLCGGLLELLPLLFVRVWGCVRDVHVLLLPVRIVREPYPPWPQCV